MLYMKTKFAAELNLDDPYEVDQFIAEHNTTKGRALANSLGFKGKDAVRAADALSCYAWNKKTAISLRTKGDIVTGQKYEAICDTIYRRDIQPLINCW
jgi:hypothetical protein